jgi:hypothetical protein
MPLEGAVKETFEETTDSQEISSLYALLDAHSHVVGGDAFGESIPGADPAENPNYSQQQIEQQEVERIILGYDH